MLEYAVTEQARAQRQEHLARAARARRATEAKGPHPTRHAMADRLRRFADRLDS